MPKRSSQRIDARRGAPRGDAAEAEAQGGVVEHGGVGEQRLLEHGGHAAPHRAAHWAGVTASP